LPEAQCCRSRMLRLRGMAVGTAVAVGMVVAGTAAVGSSALCHRRSIIPRLHTITYPRRTTRRHTMVTAAGTHILPATPTDTLRLHFHYVATLVLPRLPPTIAAHRTSRSLALGHRDSPPLMVTGSQDAARSAVRYRAGAIRHQLRAYRSGSCPNAHRSVAAANGQVIPGQSRLQTSRAAVDQLRSPD
jgi:hypothetical protein